MRTPGDEALAWSRLPEALRRTWRRATEPASAAVLAAAAVLVVPALLVALLALENRRAQLAFSLSLPRTWQPPVLVIDQSTRTVKAPTPRVGDTLIHRIPKPPATGWSPWLGTPVEVSPGVWEFSEPGLIVIHTIEGDHYEEVGPGDRVWESESSIFHSFPA